MVNFNVLFLFSTLSLFTLSIPPLHVLEDHCYDFGKSRILKNSRAGSLEKGRKIEESPMPGDDLYVVLIEEKEKLPLSRNFKRRSKR